MEEPAQPDALTLTVNADAIHAVVPITGAHEGKAMRPRRHCFAQRAATMLIKRTHGGGRLILGIALFGLTQRFAAQEGRLFGQDTGVTRGGDIGGGDIGQPGQVIANARAHPTTRGRMPPVQHIAGFKLVAGAA